MAPELLVRCLGRLSLRCCAAAEQTPGDLPLPATLKAQSLLAYLIVHRDRPQSRDHLAEIFWGDRPEHNARRSLATALWQIRRCLPGDDFILADANTVQFNPRSAFWLDMVEFEKLTRTASDPPSSPSPELKKSSPWWPAKPPRKWSSPAAEGLIGSRSSAASSQATRSC